jgi:Fe-S oxidoreductase
MATPEVLRQLSKAEKQRAVILVQDVFTSSFETDVIVDCLRLLLTLGFYPLLAPFHPNGKPSHVLGFLNQFREIANSTAEQLTQLAASGIPLVGLEPSMTLCYRSEYKKFLGEQPMPTVNLIQEWLSTQQEILRENRLRFETGQFHLFPHCTEASTTPYALHNWKEIFQALGQDLSIEQLGCCGMAGTYGHEVTHQDSSQRLFEMSWSPALKRRSENGIAVATGFSCRQQSARCRSQILLHPLQALLQQMQK